MNYKRECKMVRRRQHKNLMATFQTLRLLVGVSRDVIKRHSGEVETQLELRPVYDVQIMAFWRSNEKLFLA
jgi:hypothetical protein